jgi:hypothetical protein
MNGAWRRQFLPIVLMTVAALGSSHALAAPVADEEIEAVWKAQVVTFEYRSDSTFYNCRSLERKLRVILRSVGARDDIQFSGYVCNDISGIARFQLAFQSPVVATPENIAASSTFSSREVLAARVRGERLPTAEDVQTFPAVWKTVSFARDRAMRLAPADCELVAQLRRQILDRMSIQVVSDNVRCSPGFGNISKPRLTVAALVPATPDVLAVSDY